MKLIREIACNVGLCPAFFVSFMKFILGKKIGASQVFDEKGNVIPVTWIEAGPCFITQLKAEKTDGYSALQLGFEKKAKNVKKTEKGKEFKYLREQRTENSKKFKLGDKIDNSIFKEGEFINVSGISKAKGFQGVVKRWGFAGQKKTHGTKHATRQPGSIGAGGPEKVLKGKKMAGRTGGRRVTVKNIEVVKIDRDKNLIAVKGAVPGRKGTLLEIRG